MGISQTNTTRITPSGDHFGQACTPIAQ